MRVRSATPEDLPALARLFDAYRVFYQQPSDLDAATAFLREREEAGDSTVFVAEDEDEKGALLGFTQLYASLSSVSLARIYVLNDLYVAPAARRRGVAHALIGAAHAFARSRSAVRVSLETAHDNHGAQALYESLGYERDTHFFRYHWRRDG
jgi:ribosomal protein S18 acetylase RimI-like enzyme